MDRREYEFDLIIKKIENANSEIINHLKKQNELSNN